MVSKSKKAVGLFSYLKGANWGPKKKTLRTLYLALVRSVISYGQEVYDSTSKSILESLDKIQNSVMRKILKCPRSTSVKAMEIVCRIPPLALFRKLAINRYWTKVRTEYDHPLKTQYDKHNNPLGRTTEPFQPMGIKDKMFLRDKNLGDIQLITRPQINEPWALETPYLDLDLTKVINKKTTNEVAQKTLAMEHIDANYKGYSKIYTDGSKTKDGVASGSYWEKYDLTVATKLDANGDLAITTAELHAIKTCVDMIHDSNPPRGQKIAILTDSKSAVEALNQPEDNTVRSDLIYTIKKKYTALKTNNSMEIAIVWIPSHCEITGNDIADQAAKMGVDQLNIRNEIGLSLSEFHNKVKRIAFKDWEEDWLNSGRQTSKYLPSTKHDLLNDDTVGNDKITRLILNRPQFIYLPYVEGCAECDRSNTISHVLVHCKTYNLERELLEKQIGKHITDVSDILNIEIVKKHKSDIKSFLSKIKLPI